VQPDDGVGDAEAEAWTTVFISSLRDIAQFVGDDALEVQLGDNIGLRYFLPESVTLTYSCANFSEGHDAAHFEAWLGRMLTELFREE
jgi:hypothetical protein